jgi:hypothetical protein
MGELKLKIPMEKEKKSIVEGKESRCKLMLLRLGALF